MRTLLLLLLALPAFAQSPDVDPDTEIARRHFEEGRLLYQRNDYRAALREFEAARRALEAPALDFNIARCLDRLELVREAISAYERYLQSSPDAPDAPYVRERTKVLKERVASERASLVPSPAPVVTPPPTLAPRSHRYRAPLVVGGAALALAVVGAGLIGSVAADYDSLVGRCRPCSDQQIESLQARSNAGYALFGIAGALVVTDVVLWALAGRRPPRQAAALRISF